MTTFFENQYATVRGKLLYAGNGLFCFEHSSVYHSSDAPIHFSISREGGEYLVFRTDLRMPKPMMTRLIRKGCFATIAEYYNRFGDLQEQKIAIFRDNQLFALTNDFVPYEDETIMAAIQAAGLENNLAKVSVKRLRTHFYIMSNYQVLQGKNISWGTTISNGSTGHQALSMDAFFAVGEYYFIIPGFLNSATNDTFTVLQKKVKHLPTGKVEALAVAFSDVFNHQREYEISNKLLNVSSEQFLKVVSEILENSDKGSELVTVISGAENALDAILKLTEMMNERGYKTVAQRAIERFMKELN